MDKTFEKNQTEIKVVYPNTGDRIQGSMPKASKIPPPPPPKIDTKE